MFVQKRKEQVKEYEKQEKRLRDLKAHGSSKKAAVSIYLPRLSELSLICFTMFLFFNKLGKEAEGSFDAKAREEQNQSSKTGRRNRS